MFWAPGSGVSLVDGNLFFVFDVFLWLLNVNALVGLVFQYFALELVRFLIFLFTLTPFWAPSGLMAPPLNPSKDLLFVQGPIKWQP